MPRSDRRFLILVSTLIAALALACGSGEGDAPSGSPAKAAEGSEDPARRERREKEAARRLRVARATVPSGKAEALGEVAHLYWDTSSGAEAVVLLVEFLARKGDPDPAGALKEVETYRSAVGADVPAINAAQVLTQSLVTRLELAEDDALGEAEKKSLQDIRDKALGYWIAMTEELLATPAEKSNVTLHRGLGDARLLRGDFEGAARAWAAVETLDPPAAAADRVAVMLTRAALVKYQLARVDEARELFVTARGLLNGLDDPMARAHYAEYIAEEIGE